MSFLSTIWDAILLFFIAFLFIAYLMILFGIIRDLFADRSLGGGAKAVWLIFLVSVPFLTALIYLIARGNGMADRSVAQQAQAQQATNDYIRSVAASSPAAEIAQAKQLLDSGAITPAEYEALKARVLANR